MIEITKQRSMPHAASVLPSWWRETVGCCRYVGELCCWGRRLAGRRSLPRRWWGPWQDHRRSDASCPLRRPLCKDEVTKGHSSWKGRCLSTIVRPPSSFNVNNRHQTQTAINTIKFRAVPSCVIIQTSSRNTHQSTFSPCHRMPAE